jgi:hypothetical protein
MDLSSYPPYSTITIVRAGKQWNWNVQDYVAQDGDELVMVLRPEERAAVAQ